MHNAPDCSIESTVEMQSYAANSQDLCHGFGAFMLVVDIDFGFGEVYALSHNWIVINK